jgi:hypothetical protein
VQRAQMLAAELGLPLNFGGGLRPDDGIARFKRTFCNAVGSFVTHEIICDADVYASLVEEDAEPSEFFPAYRSLTRT